MLNQIAQSILLVELSAEEQQLMVGGQLYSVPIIPDIPGIPSIPSVTLVGAVPLTGGIYGAVGNSTSVAGFGTGFGLATGV